MGRKRTPTPTLSRRTGRGGTTLAAVSLLTLIAGCAAKQGAPQHHGETVLEDLTADEEGAALLSRYPQSPALQSTRDAYASASGGARDSVFMTTWFPAADAHVGEWSTIDPRGRVTIYRFVYDLGFQDSRTTTLVPAQIPELESLFPTLPPSSPPKTLDRLLIIGFRRAPGDWQTRLYDRATPPETIKRIFREMTGAPLE